MLDHWADDGHAAGLVAGGGGAGARHHSSLERITQALRQLASRQQIDDLVDDSRSDEIGGMVQHCVREADTVGRIGGDEFEVLLPSIDDSKQALFVAEKIRHALNRPFELAGGHVATISSSSGVAIYPEDGQDEATLSRAADVAMYRAKALGRDKVERFEPVLLTQQPATAALVGPPSGP